MPLITRRSLVMLTLLFLAIVVAAGAFVWSGAYNIGADVTHTRPVHWVLQVVREKSIEHHARDLEVPDLADAALIRSGAGNYDAMCTGCHLAPGRGETELSRGLYPAPPDFSLLTPNEPAHDFWVIKHGIKASGMPAWGRSMEDGYIWGMVAFLQILPTLDADGYQALVASSGGHSHGGGETGEHHEAGEPGGHHHDEGTTHHDGMAMDTHSHEDSATADPVEATRASPAKVQGGTMHVHADGRERVHASAQPGPAAARGSSGADAPGAAQPASPSPTAHDNDHDHQH